MKKVLAILLALTLVLSLAACGGSGDETTAASDAADGDKVYNIGICQLVQHVALDEASQGFMDKATELFGEGNVKFDMQNASNDTNMCGTITNQFVADEVDLILANATPALLAAAANTKDIPILGTSITDYSSALEIEDWKGYTGLNISGTSDLAPLDQQAAMIKELSPDVKTVGVIYCTAEPNSEYQYNEIKKHLEDLGLTVEKYTFTDSNDLTAIAASATETCDAIYTPTDNTVASNAELLQNVFLPAGIPVYCGEAGTCTGCGVATLAIKYYDIGAAAAQMAYDILVGGEDISTMEIGFAPEFTKQYNKANADELGIEIPAEYAEIAVD